VRAWGWLTALSLVHGPLHLALVLLPWPALVALLLLRRDRAWWTRRVPLALAMAGSVVGLVVTALAVLKPWPDPLPGLVLAWMGTGFLGLALLILGWRRRRRWWMRVLAPMATLLVVLGAADGIDTYFGAYPTVGAAVQAPPYDQSSPAAVLRHDGPRLSQAAPVSINAWHAPAGMPQAGAVFEANIPPSRSGFSARPAWVYVPPAYRVPDHPLLPVLVMIGGQPGGPRDWLDGGALAQQMDAWAAAHDGLAPIVVMPDGLGAQVANPLCMDSALGRAGTYLSSDVVAWVTSALQVDPNHAHWAVGGFSYGGTCALQLAVAHPDLFPTFFDASGQRTPTLGGHARTVAATFGGNEQAWAAVDPLRELAAHPEPGSAGYVVVGRNDDRYRPQALAVAAAARAAGISITYQELPGGHDWEVWRPALTHAIPWLAARMGLTP
jgi:enterochelin esterase-like enzyme